MDFVARAVTELGFCTKRIREAIDKHGCKAVDEVIDFLLSEELRNECVDNCTCETVDRQRLERETAMLLASSLCLICHRERRAVVCFPCCHMSTCKACSKIVALCPMQNCFADIEQRINVIW